MLITVKHMLLQGSFRSLLSGCVCLISSPLDKELVPPQPSFSRRSHFNKCSSLLQPNSTPSHHHGMPSLSPAVSVGYQAYRHHPTSPLTWATAGASPKGLSASTLGSLPTINSPNHSQERFVSPFLVPLSGFQWSLELNAIDLTHACKICLHLQPFACHHTLHHDPPATPLLSFASGHLHLLLPFPGALCSLHCARLAHPQLVGISCHQPSSSVMMHGTCHNV